jgi:hypothetical protein
MRLAFVKSHTRGCALAPPIMCVESIHPQASKFLLPPAKMLVTPAPTTAIELPSGER